MAENINATNTIENKNASEINGIYVPSWARTLMDKYKSHTANTFILTGNVNDYVCQRVLLDIYLDVFCKDILRMREIAIFDAKNGAKYSKTLNPHNETENFEKICAFLKNPNGRSAYIVKFPNILIGAEDRSLSDKEKANLIVLQNTLSSIEYRSSQNLVIFISENTKDLNSAFLSSAINASVINIEYPSEEERLNFIKFTAQDKKPKLQFDREVGDEELARLSAGLSLTSLDDMIVMADYKKCLTRDTILETKKELIRKENNDIIELYDTDGYGLKDFAGQDHIKAYFKDVVIDAVRDNNIDIIPKGVLLMGPPGTGKTYFSRCLAGDAGISFVEFKMSKILDKWVGTAEKNLERAFSVFRALAPVGVFIDELDQAVSRGENDSNSVRSNLFGMFLSELSKNENRGKIIWLGATNYPNNIDEALKRSGRFDKKIPFFAPEKDERKVVFQLHLNKKKALGKDIEIDYDYLADKTEGYTQAEIENIVVKALELRSRRHQEYVTMDILNDALEYMISAQNSKIKEMEDIALKECNDLEFLPEKYRERRQRLFESEK